MISSQAHICAQLHLNTSPPLISALMFQAGFDAVKSLLNYSTKVSSPMSTPQMDSTPNKKVYYYYTPVGYS